MRCLLSAAVVLASNGSAHAEQKPDGPRLGQFVLYADRSIRLGARDTVDRDIGVANAVSSSGAQCVLGDHVRVHDVYAPTTALSNDSIVQGIYGETPRPATPLAPLGAPGRGDVTVAKSDRLALAPGAYRHVHVDGTLALTSGTYSFADVTIGSHAAMLATSGPVEVRVAGAMLILDHATVRSKISASGLAIYVASSDVETEPAVTIGREALVRALVAAPHGTLRFSDQVAATGAFAASDIVAGADCSFRLEDGFDPAAPAQHGTQRLSGYLRSNPIVGAVPSSSAVTVSVGLPVRDVAGLTTLLGDISNPNSPRFRHYGTSEEFNRRFGGTDVDYTALMGWATAAGLSIHHAFSNQLLLSVQGTAAQIGNALHANLVYRQRASVESTFVSVDREPSIDFAPPILWISNLTNVRGAVPRDNDGTGLATGTGRGQAQLFMAQDLRSAYLDLLSECSALDGTEQAVGIYSEQQFDPSNLYSTINGYVPEQDIPIVRTDWPHPTTQVIPVHVDDPDFPGTSEVNLDVEMVTGFAPGAQVLVFTGGHDADATFHAMADDSRLTVVSISYELDGSSNMQQALYELAFRGVSVFVASGDHGDVGDPQDNIDLDYQTLVGGTILDVNDVVEDAAKTSWLYCRLDPNAFPVDVASACYYDHEETWVASDESLTTGGGIMASVGIPDYQQGVSMALNGGSTSHRNYPDVAAVATRLFSIDQGAPTEARGTSAAAPIWAAFAALSNQYAAAHGEPRIGWANPTLYAIGLEPDLAGSFHDVYDGVFNSAVGGFASVPGYDLATGWGSPTCQLIQQLGTHHPTSPQTFGRGVLHIANGDDGVDDDSSVRLLVHMKHSVPIGFTVKAAGESGWSGSGAAHDRIISFDPKISPYDIDYVSLTLDGSDDDWDVAGFELFLAGVRIPYGCVVNVSGGNALLSDGNPAAFRLRSADNGGPTDESFTKSGCPTWGGAADVTTFDALDFIFDTGDDDLNSDSTLLLDILDPTGVPLEHGALHRNGDATFMDHTEWRVRYQLLTPRSADEIGSLTLTLQAGPDHGEDEWGVQAVNVYGVQSSVDWVTTCVARGGYENFDTDGPASTTLIKGNCP